MKKFLLIALTLCTLNGMAQDDDLVLFFEGAKCGLKDKTGKVVVPAVYGTLLPNFWEGMIAAMNDKKWGIIDKTGNEIIPLIFDDVGRLYDGLALVKLNGKSGFFDQTGKEIIPLIYDAVGNFSDGAALAQLNGKWGFIDRTGKEIVPFIYGFIGTFSEDLANAMNSNDKWGFIDKTGKEAIPFIYDGVGVFSEGLAFAQLNGNWGFIDKTGKEIIPCIYYSVQPFKNGLAQVVQLEKKRHIIQLIKPTGEVYANLKMYYDNVGEFIDGVAIVTYTEMSTPPPGGVNPFGNASAFAALANYTISLNYVSMNTVQGVIDTTGKHIFNRSLIKRHTDGTFELFDRKRNGEVISTGKFLDKTGKKVKGKQKTNFED